MGACTCHVVLRTFLIFCFRISSVSCVAAHDDTASSFPNMSSMLGNVRERKRRKKKKTVRERRKEKNER